jgi:hypothetical protein
MLRHLDSLGGVVGYYLQPLICYGVYTHLVEVEDFSSEMSLN